MVTASGRPSGIATTNTVMPMITNSMIRCATRALLRSVSVKKNLTINAITQLIEANIPIYKILEFKDLTSCRIIVFVKITNVTNINGQFGKL